jgi:hypothetical protein
VLEVQRGHHAAETGTHHQNIRFKHRDDEKVSPGTCQLLL